MCMQAGIAYASVLPEPVSLIALSIGKVNPRAQASPSPPLSPFLWPCAEGVHEIATTTRNRKSLALDRRRLSGDKTSARVGAPKGVLLAHVDKVLGLDVVANVVGEPRFDPVRDGPRGLTFDRDEALVAPLFDFGIATSRDARVLLVEVL